MLTLNYISHKELSDHNSEVNITLHETIGDMRDEDFPGGSVPKAPTIGTSEAEIDEFGKFWDFTFADLQDAILREKRLRIGKEAILPILLVLAMACMDAVRDETDLNKNGPEACLCGNTNIHVRLQDHVNELLDTLLPTEMPDSS